MSLPSFSTLPNLRVIRAASLRATPWKNGGGTTTEIAAAPPGASLDAFDWRVSMARVATDGPFSSFAGIDRTLAVVSGDGMELAIEGCAIVMLGSHSAPLAFAGDVPTSARLTAGAITDLNVMTRRGQFTHQMVRLAQPASCELTPEIALAIVVAPTGGATISHDGAVATLDPGDAAIVDCSGDTRGTDVVLRITPDAGHACYLVLLQPRRS